MQVVLQTRFSYFGVSGWRSDASKQAALLFDEKRLAERFRIFGAVTIPSLKAQTDQDFHWQVLSSKNMPMKWRKRLLTACQSVLPAAKLDVTFRSPRSASKIFKNDVRKRFHPKSLVSQVVLDDDDALSSDFVETCKVVCRDVWSKRDTSMDYVITTFPRGCSLVLQDSQTTLLDRFVPFTNLGLTLTSRPDCKRNLFAMSHKRIGLRHPHTEFDDGKPRYLRTVHNHNDSRAMINKKASEVPYKSLARFFPQLAKGDTIQALGLVREPEVSLSVA